MAGPSLDPLIGRERELGALLELQGRVRLVTLTGPGGSGKTRLAGAAVAQLREMGTPAWFVDCSAVDDPAIVGATIAGAMDLEDVAGQDPIDAVVGALGSGDAVLALDNLEQIPAAGGVATRMLEAVPGLTVLATSRVPLRVRGEVEFVVPPLGLPTSGTPDAIAGSAAGQLFIARSRAVAPRATLDEVTAADIAALLARLDGLPLAIELAAARTRAVTPREILRRLDDRGTEAIDTKGGDQHRSLGAILDWTVDQLSPTEVETLEAVSICAGLDLDLVAALVPDVEALDTVDSLVALGLAQRVENIQARSRFRLLETIRTRALRRMSPERRVLVQDRHAEHFVNVARAWQQVAKAGATHDLVELFEADADNVRRALEYLDGVDPRRYVLLVSLLGSFWRSHGRLAEGYAHLQRAFEVSPEPSVELARAAAGQLNELWLIVPPGAFHDLAERTLQLARAVQDREALVEALRQRAYLAVNEEDKSSMEVVAAELDVQFTGSSLEDRLNRSELHAIATAVIDGRTSDRHLEASRAFIAELETADRPERLALSRGNLANSLLGRGEWAAAVPIAQLSADTFRDLDHRGDLAWALAILAPALTESGRTAEAIDSAIECAEIAIETSHGENVASALWAAIPVALDIGRPELAAGLLGALIDGVVARGEADLQEPDRMPTERWRKRIERALPRVEYQLARRDGAGADPKEVLRSLVRELRAAGVGAATSHIAPDRLRHGELTKREIEVLELVGRGMSDPEIAQTLFISPKTASVHVANIKSKLGVDSRLQIALRAREMGLGRT